MRICFVMEYHPDDHTGGAEVQAFGIARELAALGHDVSYVCQHYDRSRPVEETVDGVLVVRRIRWRRTWRFLSVPAVVREVRRLDPHVVYQRFASPFTAAAARAASELGVPFVWGCSQDASLVPGFLRRRRGRAQRGFLGGLKRMALWLDRLVADALFRTAVTRASVVIAQNERQSELLLEHFERDSVRIPNGIALRPFLPVKPDRPTVLWLNRIYPVKRPELFVELVRELTVRGVDARFVMVGGRADDSYMRALLEAAAAAPGLEMVGDVQQAETLRWFDEACLFVITSEGEGFPNVLLQAWASGAAVVSLDVDPDGLLARHGLGVLSTSFENMCADVARLAADAAERSRYASAAFAYVTENFEMRNVAERYEELFESLRSMPDESRVA